MAANERHVTYQPPSRFVSSELLDMWRDLDAPPCNFDRLIRLSADWPPHSSLDLAIYKIRISPQGEKAWRIEHLKKQYGYDAATRALEALQ